MIKINGATGKVTVHVSVFTKSEIIKIFKKDYLKSVVSHEIKHLQPNVKFLVERIIPSKSVLGDMSAEDYNALSEKFSSKF